MGDWNWSSCHRTQKQAGPRWRSDSETLIAEIGQEKHPFFLIGEADQSREEESDSNSYRVRVGLNCNRNRKKRLMRFGATVGAGGAGGDES